MFNSPVDVTLALRLGSGLVSDRNFDEESDGSAHIWTTVVMGVGRGPLPQLFPHPFLQRVFFHFADVRNRSDRADDWALVRPIYKALIALDRPSTPGRFVIIHVQLFHFYDISIVFFYALSLYLLYKRQYVLFAVTVGIATLNHENAMLLVMIAAVDTFRQNLRVCAGVTLGSLALHVVARLVMAHLYPSVLVDLRFWTNIVVPLVHPKMLIASSTAFLFWWVCASVTWPNAEPFLHRISILLPLVIAVTFTFGKLIEARQFVVVIPVVIAFLLSFARSQIETGNAALRQAGAAGSVSGG